MAGELSSIGVGTALTVRPRDNSGLIGRRMAAEKEKKERLVNLDDFSTGGSTLSPLFTRQLAQVGTDYAHKWLSLGGDDRATRQMELEKPQWIEKANNIKKTNAEVDKYVTANPKEYENDFATQLNALRNDPNTTPQQWAALHNPDQGITTTPTYGFGAILRPRVDLEGIVKTYNQNSTLDPKTAKVAYLGGGKQQMTGTKVASEQDVKSAADHILQDENALRVFTKKVAPTLNNPALFDKDDNKRMAAQHAAVYDWTRKAMTGDPFSSISDVPKPTEGEKAQSRLGWGFDQMEKNGLIAKDQTRNVGSGVEKYDYSMSLPVKGKTGISLGDGDVINMDTGKKESGVGHYEFHPDVIAVKTVDGKKKAYVDGFAVDQQEVEKNPSLKEAVIYSMQHDGEMPPGYVIDKKYLKSFSVPLEKVENFLQTKEGGSNPTKWAHEIVDRLNKSTRGADKVESLRKKYAY